MKALYQSETGSDCVITFQNTCMRPASACGTFSPPRNVRVGFSIVSFTYATFT